MSYQITRQTFLSAHFTAMTGLRHGGGRPAFPGRIDAQQRAFKRFIKAMARRT
jgi:hypothetical protein